MSVCTVMKLQGVCPEMWCWQQHSLWTQQSMWPTTVFARRMGVRTRHAAALHYCQVILDCIEQLFKSTVHIRRRTHCMTRCPLVQCSTKRLCPNLKIHASFDASLTGTIPDQTRHAKSDNSHNTRISRMALGCRMLVIHRNTPVTVKSPEVKHKNAQCSATVQCKASYLIYLYIYVHSQEAAAYLY